MQSISLEFFAQDTLTVARALVGAILRHDGTTCRIVETEAYTDDAASHFVTRPRTGAMLGTTWGRVYLYRIYGLHTCLNFTTDAHGPGAVLLRALEPLSDREPLRERRRGRPDRELMNGPGKLYVALGIDAAVHGAPVTDAFELELPADPPVVHSSPRIGVTAARELPWRFTLAESTWLSRPAAP